MSDTESAASESTIENIPFETVIDNIHLATEDVLEGKDYLSYSTLWDIYLSDIDRYSYDEREQLLELLYEILKANPALTFEIGWDLPALLMPYFESNFVFSTGIRNGPCLYKLMKIFEVLALEGNPKELILKSCELLSSISIDDITATDSPRIKERFFNLKLYCLFELIDSSLKKIDSYYPSRFLLMAVTSFINMIYANIDDNFEGLPFLYKRIYTFARNYEGPQYPESSEEYSTEELENIKKDEDYLQRKLLTSFLTNAIDLSLRHVMEGYTLDFFSYLQELKQDQLKKVLIYRLESTGLERLAELAISMDIALKKTFELFLADSRKLFGTFDYLKSGDELTGEIFENVVIDYQKNLATSITNSDARKVTNSTVGILELYSYKTVSQRDYNNLNISMYDAILFTLRLQIPSLIHRSFLNKGAQDMCVFWSWLAINKFNDSCKELAIEISKVPKQLLTIYYQSLLFIYLTNHSTDSKFGFATLTLLLKVLSESPEEIAYEFIQDSLVNCPHQSLKTALIGVLKHLLTQKKSEKMVDNLTASLERTAINETTPTSIIKSNIESTEASLNQNGKKDKLDGENGKPTETIAPPPLPARNVSANAKFILLTDSRSKDIIDLLQSTVDETFLESGLDALKLATLSAYLNLLIVVKTHPSFTKYQEQLSKILTSVEKKISSSKKGDLLDPNLANFLDVLLLTIDRIHEA